MKSAWIAGALAAVLCASAPRAAAQEAWARAGEAGELAGDAQLGALKAALAARRSTGRVVDVGGHPTPMGRRAIDAYVDSFAYLINKALRTGDNAYVSEYAGFIRQLRGALESSPVFEGVVFRGSDYPPASGPAPGSYVDPAFVSASRDLEVAEGHAGVDGYLYVILSRTGRDIGYDRGTDSLSAEREVLFENGTRFRVLRILPQPAKRRTVIFEVETP